MTKNWVEKYSPKNVRDLVCNKTSVLALNTWLKSFGTVKDSKKKTSSVVISGSHGTGKTSSVEVLASYYNYDVRSMKTLKLGSSSYNDCVLKLIKCSNVVDMVSGEKRRKVMIVVDEMESITSTTDKNFIINLQKMNDIHRYCPIIFISNNKHNKLLSEIKKHALEIKFYPPFPSDMKKILRNVVKKESISLASVKVEDKIVEHSQNDIRRMINTLQDIKYSYNDQIVTSTTLDEYIVMSKKKDVDIDLFKATEELLYNYTDIDSCLRLFETEKVLLPLMVHHNYSDKLITKYDDISGDMLDVSVNVSDMLSTGDVVENYIYGEQNWDMQEIHGFYMCTAPSYYLCKDDNSVPKIDTSFTTDLNKTSIKKINKKNIHNTDRCFNNMNVFDYICINQIVRKLIDENSIDKCVQLLKGYDAELEHILSLLKIDKIRDGKTTLSSKQQKEFITYLNNR